MNKQEAIQAMKQGKKITHTSFGDDEWMTSSSDGRQITLEDAVKLYEGEFWHFRQGSSWEDGYSLFKDKTDYRDENLFLDLDYEVEDDDIFDGEEMFRLSDREQAEEDYFRKKLDEDEFNDEGF